MIIVELKTTGNNHITSVKLPIVPRSGDVIYCTENSWNGWHFPNGFYVRNVAFFENNKKITLTGFDNTLQNKEIYL